jgi:hypothetical protein
MAAGWGDGCLMFGLQALLLVQGSGLGLCGAVRRLVMRRAGSLMVMMGLRSGISLMVEMRGMCAGIGRALVRGGLSGLRGGEVGCLWCMMCFGEGAAGGDADLSVKGGGSVSDGSQMHGIEDVVRWSMDLGNEVRK